MQQINLDKNVKIEFKPEEIGYILNVLRKQQYDQVVFLIGAIETQIIEQSQPQPKKEKIVIPENGLIVEK